jgi:alpha-galactosidase
MESDVHTPEAYGVYQSVGDTTGPGGILRSMRTVPVFAEFGRAIRRFCPEAWVINYTNPMAVCVRALYDAFPGIKAYGCCHEVFGTQKLLLRVLREETGETAFTREDIQVKSWGLIISLDHRTGADGSTSRTFTGAIKSRHCEVETDVGDVNGGQDAGAGITILVN